MMQHILLIVVYCSRVGFDVYKCSGPPASISDIVEPIAILSFD